MVTLEKAKEARSKKINKIENIKTKIEPQDAYKKLEEIAKGGWENLSKEDSAFFLKCFGLFIKENDFMLRIRIPGGKLDFKQAKKIGELAQKYGNDYIDLTTRMQVELRYIKIEDIATVIKELESVGITTYQTGIDNIRNIVTDPLDGYAHDNIIYTHPILEQMQEVFLKKSEYIGTLPRKFNSGILGSLSNSCNIYGHDCSFVLAQKDGIWGFNIYLGGKVGQQAICANSFVKPNEVAEVFKAIIDTYKKYGYRDNRNKNRLYYLIQDVGTESFMDAAYSLINKKRKSAGVNMVQSQPINFGSNKILTKDGKFAMKLTVASGIFSGSDLINASEISEILGDGNLRIDVGQNLWILGISKPDEFNKTPLAHKYKDYQNIYFNDMIACAGTATCSFGVIPNKPDAIEMSKYLNKEIPLKNGLVRINWSACPKGCGIHGIADIGLEGCKAKDEDGNRVDGVHIFFGGKVTKEAKEAYILHKSLPITEAREHIKYILKAYKKFKKDNESFESFEERFFKNYSHQAIAFWTKINYLMQKWGIDAKLELEEKPKSLCDERHEIFNFGLKLYKLLTGQKRFEGVDDLEAIEIKPKKIKEDTVSKLNPKVPLSLSKALYLMTHEDKNKRAKVFTEILTILKG